MPTRDEFLTAHLPRDGGTVGGVDKPIQEVVQKARIQLKKRELRGSLIRYLDWLASEAQEAHDRLLNGADMSSVEDQVRNCRDYSTTCHSLVERYRALEELG